MKSQELRGNQDLIVFGTNQIEFAHITYPRGDAAALVRFGKIVDKFGLKVSVFQPEWPSNVTAALFKSMVRIDAVLHEGGGGPVSLVSPRDIDKGLQSVLTNLEEIATA